MMKAIALGYTYLKRAPIGYEDLKGKEAPLSDVEVCEEGRELEILGVYPVDSLGHVYLVPAQRVGDYGGWWAYAPDWKIEGEAGNDPVESQQAVAIPSAKDKLVKISGISAPVPVNQAVYVGSNFTWSELTKGGSRLPADAEVTVRLVKLARYLDGVRAFLGNKPMTITSGYRPEAVNKAVGGASRSRHVQGDAADFRVAGMSEVEVFNKLKGYHKTGGLAVGNGFVHIDLRPGPPVRWHYPGGPRVELW